MFFEEIREWVYMWFYLAGSDLLFMNRSEYIFKFYKFKSNIKLNDGNCQMFNRPIMILFTYEI